MSFCCGFLIALIFVEIAHAVVKQKKYDRWTLDEFKLFQEAELKEFLLHKEEQEKEETKGLYS